MWFDSATFRDKGTELRSLSLDKRTTGQAQNLATGRDGILTAFSVLGCPTGRERREPRRSPRSQAPSRPPARSSLAGDVSAGLAGVCFALYLVLARRAGKRGEAA